MVQLRTEMEPLDDRRTVSFCDDSKLGPIKHKYQTRKHVYAYRQRQETVINNHFSQELEWLNGTVPLREIALFDSLKIFKAVVSAIHYLFYC